jgi:hypothetical protein
VAPEWLANSASTAITSAATSRAKVRLSSHLRAPFLRFPYLSSLPSWLDIWRRVPGDGPAWRGEQREHTYAHEECRDVMSISTPIEIGVAPGAENTSSKMSGTSESTRAAPATRRKSLIGLRE